MMGAPDWSQVKVSIEGEAGQVRLTILDDGKGTKIGVTILKQNPGY